MKMTYFVLTCIVVIAAVDVGAEESLILADILKLRLCFGMKLSGDVVPGVVVMNVDDVDAVLVVEITS